MYQHITKIRYQQNYSMYFVFYDNIANLLEKCHYLNNKDEAIANYR